MAQTISPNDAASLLASGEAILIDVREPDEFKEEHIAYASSLPLSNLENLLKDMAIPSSRKIIFHCLKGMRGEKACATVLTLGSAENEILNMTGGINGWKDAQLPTIKTSAGMSIFRQVQVIVGSLIAILTVLGFTGLTIGFILAGIFGTALFFAGLTGWCGLAMILKKMPWNK